jgi:hypothetical protein
LVVSVTVVECTCPPPVAVIVIVNDRLCVRLVVPTVNVDWALVCGPRVTPDGLKPIVIPVSDGEMLDDKFTRPVNPFAAVMVTV